MRDRGRASQICLSLMAATLVAKPAMSNEEPADRWAVTLYVAQISSERTWQKVIRNPFAADYADAYLVAAGFSRPYAHLRDDALRLEMEGNVAWNFGDQHHLEFNIAPVTARWRRFPWDHRLATSAAFGLGLSYATERPEVEVEIEGDTNQLLIFWFAELTAGPREAPWAVTVRLHHRSVAWGLFGEEGGMNAIGLGVRYQF
jgi:phytoene dehydrogenase-like protein